MNLKGWLYWLYDKGKNYNLFMPEVEDYPDDENEEREDSQIILKYQKYTTRLYILLLLVSLYILFYLTLIQSYSRTVNISNITTTVFNEHYAEHAESLSCPCSNITIPYRTFVFNRISFDPICSSIFVTKQWIESLYLINASDYGITDFRTTAKSQFQLLSDFCSVCKERVHQKEIEFNNNEYVTIDLLSERKIQSEINASIQVLKENLFTEIVSFVNYLRIYIRSNYFVSALNTNLMLSTYLDKTEYKIYQLQTQYTEVNSHHYSENESILCSTDNPIIPVGFFPSLNSTGVYLHSTWYKPTEDIRKVEGFFAGCTPVEGILSSTLDCLYKIECIQLLISYFPTLKQFNFNLNESILSKRNLNKTVYDRLHHVFVDEWLTEMNYSTYFSSCSASSCSYRTKDSINWSYAITIFMSFYGGLTIILRFLSLFLMKLFFKLKRTCNRRLIDRKKLLKWIKQMNLFKNVNERSENEIKQQKIITRIYLLLLLISILIFLLFNSLTTTITTQSLSKPSLETYKHFENVYSNNFRCSCSERIISYKSLIRISPKFHQICSSDFITNRWLSIVSDIYDRTPQDWRNRANGFFNFLSRICQLATNTINESIRQFLFQSLIVTDVLSEFEFEIQLNLTLNQFIQSTRKSFVSLIDIVHILTQIDQFYMGSIPMEWTTVQEKNLVGQISKDNLTNKQLLKVIFKLPGIYHVNLSSINCICTTNASCQSPIAIYQMDYIWNSRIRADIDYIVPGSFAGCSDFDTLLYSQLVCFYSNSNCSSILMKYLKDSYYFNVKHPNWFDPHLLVYNQTLSRYPPSTPISVLIKELMIEQWNSSYSYETFYHLCSPNHCTYTEKIHTNTILSVFIILLSMLGGLTVSLRLITPWIVIAGYKIFEMIFKRRGRREQTSVNRWNQLKITIKNSILIVYENLINLNIFFIRDLGNHHNQTMTKSIGIWSTRLYFSLFVIGSIILTLYTIIQPENSTKTYQNPSLDLYNQLKFEHKDKLKCLCSSIGSKYEEFIQIKPVFHQICRTSLISNEWPMTNISISDQRHYSRFAFAHIQYLDKLCKHSIEIEQDSIKQFLNSLLITSELLSEKNFYSRIHSLIEQRKQNTPKKFSNLFFLIRSISHGNAYISMYGTNYQYISNWFDTDVYYPYISSRAMIYDNQCSCGIQSNCTTQAYFYLKNSTTKLLLKGLKMGCTPSESLHASTLECFYDQSCLDYIQQFLNTTIHRFSIQKSQYHMNTTVFQLIENLFVEEWITSMNYSSYYYRCLPSLCSHTYIQTFNILYFITYIIGLQGGLTIVLNWISPKIIRIIIQIYEKRKKRLNVVQPLSPAGIVILSNTNNNPNHIRTTSISNQLLSTKVCLVCSFVVSIILGLILFSVYFTRSTTTAKPLITSSIPMTITVIDHRTTSTVVTTTNTTTSLTNNSISQMKFQLTMNYQSDPKVSLKSPVVADFNEDDLLDIVFFNYATNSCHVLIGDGKGNYTDERKTFVGSFKTWAFFISTGDFDEDKHLDVIFTSENRDYVYLLFGNGNGTFRSLTTIYMGYLIRTRGIGIFDLNNDTHLDVALASQSDNFIFVLLGYGNGSFAGKASYYTGPNTSPSSLALADINHDQYEDIIYNNIGTRTIGILLGNGDGTFKNQITSFVGGYYNPSFIAIGDFNGDQNFDVAISYSDGNHIGILLGYGNGSMKTIMKYSVLGRTYYGRLDVGDLNNDGYSDIVIGSIFSYKIHILISDGDENFHIEEIFSPGFDGHYSWMNIADFNNDGCQDILASDESDLGSAVFILMNTCI